MREGERRSAPASSAAPLRGSPAGLLRSGLSHSAAPEKTRRSRGRRRRALLSFAQAFPAQQKDLRVFHQPVGDGRGDGGVEQDVAPVGEGSIGGDHAALLLTVARGDNLIKKIRGLLVEREISQLVAD